jgi:hypothetical protein
MPPHTRCRSAGPATPCVSVASLQKRRSRCRELCVQHPKPRPRSADVPPTQAGQEAHARPKTCAKGALTSWLCQLSPSLRSACGQGAAKPLPRHPAKPRLPPARMHGRASACRRRNPRRSPATMHVLCIRLRPPQAAQPGAVIADLLEDRGPPASSPCIALRLNTWRSITCR